MHNRLPDDAVTIVSKGIRPEWWTGERWNTHAEECPGPGRDCPYSTLRFKFGALYIGFVAQNDAIDARRDQEQLDALRDLWQLVSMATALPVLGRRTGD